VQACPQCDHDAQGCRRTASSYGIPVIFGDVMAPWLIRDLDTESPVSHHVHAELDELLPAYGIELRRWVA
jgi:hypothetical protein